MKQRRVGAKGVDAAEYWRILDAGMGRAVCALSNEADMFSETILAACMRYSAFDPATEGERSEYLFRVLEAAGDLSTHRDAILAGLIDPAARRYDLAQRFALAACFARRGDETARRAIYDAFTQDTLRLWNPRDGSVVGAVEIIALDGWQGFLVVADRLGTLREAHEHIWFTDGLLTLIERQYGVRESTLALLPLLREHARIAAFVAEAHKHRRAVMPLRDPSPHKTQISYTQMRALITHTEGRKLRRSLAHWGMEATTADLLSAARDLAYVVSDPEQAAAYASLFAYRPFPADPAPLLALARGRDPGAAQAALTALAHIAHPAVRALAQELWDDPLRRVMAVDLLAVNYAPGDEERILAALDDDASLPAWHWLGYGALKVFTAHPGIAAVVPLHRIYERTPCSHCRYRAVALLRDLGQLSEAMVCECRHDAHAETRALVGGTPMHRTTNATG